MSPIFSQNTSGFSNLIVRSHNSVGPGYVSDTSKASSINTRDAENWYILGGGYNK